MCETPLEKDSLTNFSWTQKCTHDLFRMSEDEAPGSTTGMLVRDYRLRISPSTSRTAATMTNTKLVISTT